MQPIAAYFANRLADREASTVKERNKADGTPEEESDSLAAYLRVEFRVQIVEQTTKTERRVFDRLPISVPFFVRGNKPNAEEFLEFATALNVSATGALLAMRRFVDPGSKLVLEIPVSLANKAQLPRSVSLLHATVLRCTPDRQYFLLGVRFREPLLSESTGTAFEQ